MVVSGQERHKSRRLFRGLQWLFGGLIGNDNQSKFKLVLTFFSSVIYSSVICNFLKIAICLFLMSRAVGMK